ncbi:hypothetical protein ACC691_36980, partial [Rhizobium johnstonii]|uniref:hypothetical protein n=1 Tax=Rhizobium johnstonii TaxID=3019933 RepID=UPI003F9C75CE
DNLNALMDDDCSVSEAIAAFRGRATEVAGRIQRAHERYDGVGRAMLAYSTPLSTAQALSVQALENARGADADASNAEDLIDYYQRRIDDPATPPANLAHFRDRLIDEQYARSNACCRSTR